MNKRTVSILLAAMTAVSLTSCGSTQKAEEEGKSEGKTKLVYATWNENQKESIQKTIDGFNKVYPDIEVEIQVTPWAEYWTKMEAAAGSGNLPDIITMHTNEFEKYAKAGALAELEDLNTVDENFSYENYEEGITNLYVYDGKHYGVPKDKDCVVLVYNKDIFDAAGMEYPTGDWNWDDLYNAAEKLTDKDNGIYGFNAYNNEQEAWGNFLYENDGGFIDEEKKVSLLDSDKSIEAMEFFMDMNHKFSPSKEMLAETDVISLFASGKIAMQPIGNWQLSYFTDNEDFKDSFEIAPLPAGPTGIKATISNGLSLSIPADCKNMDAAKKFVAYAGSEQGMKDAAEGPAIPCYTGIDQVWAEAHKSLYDTEAILDSLSYGVQLPGSELKTQWSQSMYKYVGKIFDGSMDVEPALKQASVEMNEILKKES